LALLSSRQVAGHSMRLRLSAVSTLCSGKVLSCRVIISQNNDFNVLVPVMSNVSRSCTQQQVTRCQYRDGVARQLWFFTAVAASEFDLLANSGKVFVGYSDFTLMHPGYAGARKTQYCRAYAVRRLHQ
jgi:hypothetical protein